MATTKYFHGEVELVRIQPMSNKEFAARFPGVKGRRSDSFSRLVGMPLEFKPVYIQGEGWSADYHPVERIIAYKSNPSKHKCDGRCLNAKGGNCECECGGKNHGAGFRCEAA